MLAGDKVRLREPRREDTAILNEFWNDIDVATLGSRGAPTPISLEQTQKLLDEIDARDDHARFIIEVDGVVVGDCSLHHIHKHNRNCEIGIAIGKPFWNKGYGQDALRTLVAYAFTHHNMHRVGLEVLADDDRAVTCYRKVGFVEEGRIRQRDWVNGEYHDVLVMGILDEEWS